MHLLVLFCANLFAEISAIPKNVKDVSGVPFYLSAKEETGKKLKIS